MGGAMHPSRWRVHHLRDGMDPENGLAAIRAIGALRELGPPAVRSYVLSEKMAKLKSETRSNFLFLQILIIFLLAMGLQFVREDGPAENKQHLNAYNKHLASLNAKAGGAGSSSSGAGSSPAVEGAVPAALLEGFIASCGSSLKAWYLAYFVLYAIKYLISVYQFCSVLGLPCDPADLSAIDANTTLIRTAEKRNDWMDRSIHLYYNPVFILNLVVGNIIFYG